jgi:hypothetical protein
MIGSSHKKHQIPRVAAEQKASLIYHTSMDRKDGELVSYKEEINT